MPSTQVVVSTCCVIDSGASLARQQEIWSKFVIVTPTRCISDPRAYAWGIPTLPRLPDKKFIEH
jgi:hypothetical protein